MNTVSTSGIKKAMILAAGLGTRFKPWTDLHPKALAPVNGKSLLQRNIEYLQRYGIRDVVVNVHHFAGQIEAALQLHDGWGSHITISDETDHVLETGGGLQKARPWLENAPFVVMNVDILTDLDLSEMIRDHFRHRPLATLAVSDRITSRYFLFNDRQELCGWRNTKTGEEKMARPAGFAKASGVDGEAGDGEAADSGAVGGEAADGGGGVPADGLIQRAFSGIHVIDPAIFPLMRQHGKFSMVDVYLGLAASHTIRGYDHSGSKLIDVGRPESADLAARIFP